VKSKATVLVLIIFLGILTFFGVCASTYTTPFCNITAIVLNVSFEETHFHNNSGWCDYQVPSRYIIHINITNVSSKSILDFGPQNCTQFYSPNSEVYATIYVDYNQKNFSLKKGRLIESLINTAGDECFGVTQLFDYKIIGNVTEDSEIPANFFIRLWNWVIAIFR
jgi:hypothetical protein